MADVWQRHLGDAEQAEQLYARARTEGWADPRAGALPAPAPTPAPASALPAPAPPIAPNSAALASPFGDDEFEFYPDLECDLELEEEADDVPIAAEPVRADESQITLTMPDLEEPPSAGEQRSSRVLGVLERKLAERENRGAGLDAESLHLRLRIAELRAGVQADPVAAIAVLEPALASPSALVEVAPTLAGLYEQLGRSEPLIDLAERAASASGPREQREFWLRRAAEAARAAGAPERAIECYRRLLGDFPRDHGARAALGDLYRSRGDAGPLVRLLREELPRADRDRELGLQRELASLVADGLGDPIGAIPHLRRCLELEPARAELLERALSACALQGGPLAQLDLVEHICDRADGDTARAALLARRGALLADALQWNEEAAESWRAALALDPGQPLARARLASISA
jgi:tetratricopeptide (TPR) repeat protein